MKNRGHCSVAITPFSIERDSTGPSCACQKCLRTEMLGCCMRDFCAGQQRGCGSCSTSGTDGSSKLQRRREYGPRISNPIRSPRKRSPYAGSPLRSLQEYMVGCLKTWVYSSPPALRLLTSCSCSSRFCDVGGDARSFKDVLLHSHWTHLDLDAWAPWSRNCACGEDCEPHGRRANGRY